MPLKAELKGVPLTLKILKESAVLVPVGQTTVSVSAISPGFVSCYIPVPNHWCAPVSLLNVA